MRSVADLKVRSLFKTALKLCVTLGSFKSLEPGMYNCGNFKSIECFFFNYSDGILLTFGTLAAILPAAIQTSICPSGRIFLQGAQGGGAESPRSSGFKVLNMLKTSVFLPKSSPTSLENRFYTTNLLYTLKMNTHCLLSESLTIWRTLTVSLSQE